jgi:arsenite methyltransferase
VVSKFYGCGTPLPTSIEGLDVLDLGCGSGRDCYAASVLVGAEGSVTGIDMTAEQLATAREHQDELAATLGYSNMRFVEGMIEFIGEAGVAAESMDLVISNCVVNLSPDKEAVCTSVSPPYSSPLIVPISSAHVCLL